MSRQMESPGAGAKTQVAVFVIVRNIPDSPWYLVAKIESPGACQAF
jgi:hypothetical protein